MRRLIFCAALALAACGQPSAPSAPAEEAPAPATVEAPPEPETTIGPLTAVSTTAMSITGDMAYSQTRVSFMNGIELRTTRLATGAAFDRMNAAGESFDDAAPGADDRIVDLRRVDTQEVTNAPQGGLCGDTPPTYVALLYKLPITGASVIAYSGADPPGSAAAATAVCAVYSYAVD